MNKRALVSALCGLVVSLGACGEDGNENRATSSNDAGHSHGDGDHGELDSGSEGDSAVTASDASAGMDAADAATTSDAAPTPDAGAETDATLAMQDVEIAFEARVGDEQFSCEAAYEGLGTVTTLSTVVSDFRFYVHDVKLIRADQSEVDLQLAQGSAWQYDNVALLDFEDRKGGCAATGTAETNKSVWGKVPAGSYTGISFVVGVPEAYNHTDTAGKNTPSPLNIQAMAWNWASGRKFLRIDMASTESSDAGAPTDAGKFVIHLGSTACPKMGEEGAGEPDSCKNPNRAKITLASFDPATSKIAFDLAAVVSGSALNFNTTGTASGCMSAGNDPECPAIFERFGLSLATGLPDATIGQSVFSVVAK
jgi:uncharacterized repeat protein (TIGR04052 family)